MERALIWFRKDLRINDNEAFFNACKNSHEVLPVFIDELPLKRDLPYSQNEDSIYKTAFIKESLVDLDNSLRKFGGRLLCLKGQAEDLIPKLCQKYHINQVFAMAEYAFDEVTIEEKLSKKLESQGVTLKLFHTSSLIHPGDLPFEIEDLPDVFTAFRKKVEKSFKIRELYPVPNEISFVEVNESSAITFLQETNLSVKFKGGETEAFKRVNHYIHQEKKVLNYKETRNQLLGMDYSTKFSPWLAHGCISAKSVYYHIKKFESEVSANQSTYWVIFELLWRDYFRYVMMKYGSRLFLKGGIKGVSEKYQKSFNDFNRWKNGETGQPFIDANMKELNATGFMSNRGRQNVASYLVHDLRCDWRLGASYFEQMLVDYDVYSNWGNWAYVAGVGNDPRENRKFNPEKQASMYDPKGEFINYWLT